jgi:hypothetical protein
MHIYIYAYIHTYIHTYLKVVTTAATKTDHGRPGAEHTIAYRYLHIHAYRNTRMQCIFIRACMYIQLQPILVCTTQGTAATAGTGLMVAVKEQYDRAREATAVLVNGLTVAKVSEAELFSQSIKVGPWFWCHLCAFVCTVRGDVCECMWCVREFRLWECRLLAWPVQACT